MNTPVRPLHQGAASPQSHAPNAALLIDFDNVTMGIRSDLTRELRNLLDSEVIRGKVAVQRAYADWRRYPQYIVPLSEASIDLIFAPAYGSSKKNATDIRLAIDALELVFTRPEIGTFMLLSGDSDFSSLVLKLKEYGKYVIGVGIRESASDLLVQNCDEYYSYSALTGLTAAGEDAGERHDPWELVERAVLRMEKNGDVMRSDRLKQVMLEMDPGFDEKELGFTKYNKFLTEAASKNRLSLNKLENGQFEVASAGKGGDGGGDREDRKGRGGRGRGRERGRGRGRRDEAQGDGGPRPEARDQGAPRQRPDEGRAEPSERPAVRELPGDDVGAAPAGDVGAAREGEAGATPEGEAYAYGLLARAVADIGDDASDAVRDSELKRRMLELDASWDEATLGFSKFSRFLRRAHDEEVIDLHRTPEGHFEAVLGAKASRYRGRAGSTGGAASREAAARPDGRDAETSRNARDRGRSGRRGRSARDEEPTSPSERDAARPDGGAAEDAAPVPATAAETAVESEPAEAPSSRARADEDATDARAEDSSRSPAAPAPAAPLERPRSWGRSRRGGSPSGPPPVLPGQKVGGSGLSAGASKSDASGGAEPRASTDGDGAGADGGRLPEERSEVIRYLVARYKGVGERTASTVVDAFGPTEVFRVLGDEPERVRELVGPARAQMLIDGWAADSTRR